MYRDIAHDGDHHMKVIEPFMGMSLNGVSKAYMQKLFNKINFKDISKDVRGCVYDEKNHCGVCPGCLSLLSLFVNTRYNYSFTIPVMDANPNVLSNYNTLAHWQLSGNVLTSQAGDCTSPPVRKDDE